MGMRKKLGSLLKNGFKTKEFKTMVNLAISRLAVLKNQRQARCSIARSDVLQILNLGNHERALLRVEQVMKEQNLLDVYDLIEGYCHLMLERINLIEKEKECPEELVEAVSSLIHASTGCADFPELKEIRKIFASRYGKEFVARAVELRNNCRVHPKIVQKLSTRMPSLENKMKVLMEMASDNNIVLQIGTTTSQEQEDSGRGNHQKLQGFNRAVPEGIASGEDFTDSVKAREKYKDVAHAAQVAFESAAYAASAARAAVELYRSESIDPEDSSCRRPTKASTMEQNFEEIFPLETHYSKKIEKTGEMSSAASSPELKDDNIKEMTDSELEGMEKFEKNEDGTGYKRSFSASSSVLSDETVSENEHINKTPSSKAKESKNEEKDVVHFPLRSGAGFEPRSEHTPENLRGSTVESIEPLNIYRRPISVRNIPKHDRW